MSTRVNIIKKNIATGVRKEKQLLPCCSHFQPALEEAKMLLEMLFFENNKLKNETKELATIVNTPYNFF